MRWLRRLVCTLRIRDWAGVDADHFKQQSLGTPVAIAERVDDVEFAVVVRQSSDELRVR